LCASILAASGWDVSLFDHRGPWEKPCGGGVTHKAILRYPFLKESLEKGRQIRSLRVTSPREIRTQVPLTEPISIYSRTALNGLLLDRATASGAHSRKERVLVLRRNGSQWELTTERTAYKVNFVVGADGINSFVRRRLSRPFVSSDLMMTYGYRASQDLGDRIDIRFFPKFLGYYWAFPRTEHVSFGICGRLSQYPTSHLKSLLHKTLREAGYLKDISETSNWSVYSALIPSLRPDSLRHDTIAGHDWALIGDAAGFADPITCEGIYFALRSGELLADALLENDVSGYTGRCRAAFLDDFINAAEIFERFYTGNLLGSDFLTRMVQLTSRSKVLRGIMNDFVDGRQDYRSLRSRLVWKTPQIMLDVLQSTWS